MGCRFLVCLMLAAFALGCGGDTPKSSATESTGHSKTTEQVRASKDEKRPAESVKEPAPRRVINSARELAEVLDLGALPVREGTKFERKTAADAVAQVPGTVADVSAYYQKTFSERGWEIVTDPKRKNTDEYAALQFGKNGHLISLALSKHVDPKEKEPQTLVIMEFHGNLDTRTLPSPADGKPLSSSQLVTSYVTEGTVAEALEWVSKALGAEGWQRFTKAANPPNQTGASRTVRFRKQGYSLLIFIDTHPIEKKTFFQYMVYAVTHELPTPAAAAKVQFDDAGWELNCELPGDWKAAAEFYQKAMPALGYKSLPGEEPKPTYWNLRFGTPAGDVIAVQVESKDQKTTQVRILGVPAATMEAIKKKEEKSAPKK